LILPPLWYLSLRADRDAPGSIPNAARAIAPEPVIATVDEDDGEAHLREAFEAYRTGADRKNAILYDALEWAINNTGEYGFDELALGDERLTTLYELVSRLSSVGFQGTLRLGVHGGQFCLARNEFGGYDLPASDSPMSACEIINDSYSIPPAIADLQSVAFANFLSSSPLVNDGKIAVEIVSHGQDRPLFEYPARAAVRSAREWNRIAQRNNRVELSIIPSTP